MTASHTGGVPFVRVPPTAVLPAATSVTGVTTAPVRVGDSARDVEDWACADEDPPPSGAEG